MVATLVAIGSACSVNHIHTTVAENVALQPTGNVTTSHRFLLQIVTVEAYLFITHYRLARGILVK